MRRLRQWIVRLGGSPGMLESAWQDVRYALRTLRKAPGFTAIALLTFALGIGANTAVFSVVNAILLRPLPFVAPDRLASIWPTKTISPAELVYMQNNTRAFAAVGAFSPGWGIAMTGGGEPRQLDAARVSTNFFQLLGVRPPLGRAFAEGESVVDQSYVVVLSDALWKTQFGGDSAVLGRVVDMDGRPHRVVGVAPPGFEAFQPGVDAWLPLQIDPTSAYYTGSTAYAFGRLAPGASLASANAEIAAFVPRMRAAFNYTDDYGRGGTVIGLHDRLVGSIRQTLLVLLGAVVFVLLIAGANVGNLMLLQVTGRRRELAVRRALGASRGQIVQQLLVQSLVIALLGGVLGVLFGFAGVRALKAVLPPTLPMLASVTVDARVLALSAAVTMGIGLLFGIAPALFASAVDPDGAMRVGPSNAPGRASAGMRRGLVILEIALAMMLVVGAGLMTESLWSLGRVNLGFDPRGVLSFRIQPSSGQVKTPEQIRVYFDELTRRLAAVPGVERVGAAQHLPLSGFNWGGDLEIEQRPIPATSAHPRVTWRSVVGDYFGAMKIPLRRGRLFAATDTRDAPPVVVINETMAKHFWPGEDPIGQRIKAGNGTRKEWATVVGVVGDVHFLGADTPPGDEIYRPNEQQALVFMHFALRVRGNPLALLPGVKAAVRSLDTTVPIAEVRSLEDLYSASTATPRTIALLLLAFAGVGLVLGAVGIYGVISYAVGQRTREIGIRVALGAIQGRVVGMVVGEGVRLALGGIAIGALGAVFAARSLRTLLFGVTTTDGATYLFVAVALAIVAAAASYIPARRAARVDPLEALRTD